MVWYLEGDDKNSTILKFSYDENGCRDDKMI